LKISSSSEFEFAIFITNFLLALKYLVAFLMAYYSPSN
jgi:hypothetical protein